jgi:hypothetical protein
MAKRKMIIGRPRPGLTPARSGGDGGCLALRGAYLGSAMNAVRRPRIRPLSTSRPADLFGSPSQLPEGFRYSADLLTPEEEESLASELSVLPFKPFDFNG